MSTLRSLSIGSVLLSSVCLLPGTASAYETSQCPVDPAWISNPSLPAEVKKSDSDGTSNFCDFYQFSTQTFLYLMSPSGQGDMRNFQKQASYPVLESNSDGTPADSCDESIVGPTLRTSLAKDMSTGQAGGGATIYAQDGNVVYYDVRFNKSLCDVTSSAVEMNSQNLINFPSGTMELKFAWKKLSQSEIDAATFVTQKQVLSGSPATLGLVGMHIAVATTDHPEFVWATYEHKKNTPDCTPARANTNKEWMFSSESCANGLPDSADEDDSCKFNQPESNLTSPTGIPTNICRVFPYGTGSSDLKAGENIADITQQNAELLGLLSKPETTPSMKTLTHYFTVGALWVTDITQSSGGIDVPNERGSLRLANSVAETDYQHVDLTADFSSNCFGCHNYKGTSEAVSNNITSQALSHIFTDIKIGQGLDIDVTSSTVIADNSKAAAICGGDETTKGVCEKSSSYLKWNGNWTNMNTSAGSVCGCTLSK